MDAYFKKNPLARRTKAWRKRPKVTKAMIHQQAIANWIAYRDAYEKNRAFGGHQVAVRKATIVIEKPLEPTRLFLPEKPAAAKNLWSLRLELKGLKENASWIGTYAKKIARTVLKPLMRHG